MPTLGSARILLEVPSFGGARICQAWIFSGGSDSGVMKLIGDVKSRYNIEAPLIGFVPWDVIHHRQKLEEAGGKDRKVPVLYKRLPPTVDNVSLNPHHTHFLLVDGGETNEPAWGMPALRFDRCTWPRDPAPVWIPSAPPRIPLPGPQRSTTDPAPIRI